MTFKDQKLNLNVVPLALKKLWGGAKSLSGKDLDTRVENLYVILKIYISKLKIIFLFLRQDVKLFLII